MRRNTDNGCLGFFVAVIFTMPFIIWGAVRGINSIQFNVNCGGYLKRASDANTVEMARGELQKAIAYAEKNKLTEGSTRLIFDYPSCDVGFWFNNLKASDEELSKVTKETSQLEKTNLLIKLRETLLDHAKEGVTVTLPEGISVFPYNWPFGVDFTFDCVYCLACVVCHLR